MSRGLEKQSNNVKYLFRLKGSRVSDILHNISMAIIENNNYKIYNNNTLNYISKDKHYYRYMYFVSFLEKRNKYLNMKFLSILLINLLIEYDVVFFVLFSKNIKITVRYKKKYIFEWSNMKYKKHNFNTNIGFTKMRKKYHKQFVNVFNKKR